MIELNTIYNKDVLEFLSSIKSGFADLVIADPPYGIEKYFGADDNWADTDEWIKWCESWITECKRILNPTGSILIYGIHNYICHNHVTLYKLGMKYRRQFIWHYENGFCGNTRLPRATYESILWFTKSDDFYFEEIREPYKSQNRLKYKIKKNGKTWHPNPKGRIAGDVWNIPTLAGKRFQKEKVDHPTQKPILLSDRLARHFCKKDGLIIIPFAGSGSECISAYQLDRNFVASEINPQYCELAAHRLEAIGWNKPAKTFQLSLLQQ